MSCVFNWYLGANQTSDWARSCALGPLTETGSSCFRALPELLQRFPWCWWLPCSLSATCCSYWSGCLLLVQWSMASLSCHPEAVSWSVNGTFPCTCFCYNFLHFNTCINPLSFQTRRMNLKDFPTSPRLETLSCPHPGQSPSASLLENHRSPRPCCPACRIDRPWHPTRSPIPHGCHLLQRPRRIMQKIQNQRMCQVEWTLVNDSAFFMTQRLVHLDPHSSQHIP